MQENKANVLVVAAHPDDEVLGCGGTLARHAANGDHVNVLILADGVSSRHLEETEVEQQAQNRRENARQAARILGIHEPEFFSYPDNRMDTVDLLEIVQVIESVIDRLSPDIVYTHHSSDVNIDHRIVHDAVITAVRPQPGQMVKKLLFFEIPSSTEWRPDSSLKTFAPNYFVEITDTLEKKMDALRAYDMEMREFPHARSIEACRYLIGWRGATIGVEAAEAFETGRIIK